MVGEDGEGMMSPVFVKAAILRLRSLDSFPLNKGI